jgi:hypothetical protein
LTGRLSAEQRKRLDALTEHREGSNMSWLAWLRQIPEAATPSAMLGLIERLEHVRHRGVATSSTRRAWRSWRARPGALRCSMSPVMSGSVGTRH